jgi:hypothetical protein
MKTQLFRDETKRSHFGLKQKESYLLKQTEPFRADMTGIFRVEIGRSHLIWSEQPFRNETKFSACLTALSNLPLRIASWGLMQWWSWLMCTVTYPCNVLSHCQCHCWMKQWTMLMSLSGTTPLYTGYSLRSGMIETVHLFYIYCDVFDRGPSLLCNTLFVTT